MGFWKNVLLVFLSILLIISIVFFISSWSMNLLLYPSVYENAFEKNNAYGQFNNVILTSIGIPSGLVNFTEEEIKNNINVVIEDTLTYARGDNNEGVYLNIYGQSINVLDTFDKGGSVEELRNIVIRYKNTVYISAIVALLLIGLIFFFSLTHTSRAFRWVGIDLFVSGVIVFFSGSFIGNMIKNSINLQTDFSFLKSTLTDIISPVLGRIEIVGIIFAVIGVLLFIVSFFLKSKKSQKSKSN